MKISQGISQNTGLSRPGNGGSANRQHAVMPAHAPQRSAPRETRQDPALKSQSSEVTTITPAGQRPSGLPNAAFAAQLIDQTTMAEDEGVYLIRDRTYRTTDLSTKLRPFARERFS